MRKIILLFTILIAGCGNVKTRPSIVSQQPVEIVSTTVTDDVLMAEGKVINKESSHDVIDTMELIGYATYVDVWFADRDFTQGVRESVGDIVKIKTANGIMTARVTESFDSHFQARVLENSGVQAGDSIGVEYINLSSLSGRVFQYDGKRREIPDFVKVYAPDVIYEVGDVVFDFSMSGKTISFHKKITEDDYFSHTIITNYSYSTDVIAESDIRCIKDGYIYLVVADTGGGQKSQKVKYFGEDRILHSPVESRAVTLDADCGGNIVDYTFYGFVVKWKNVYRQVYASIDPTIFSLHGFDDHDFWELQTVDFFSYEAPLNQNRITDPAIDTLTDMPTGGEYVFQITQCNYDFLAVRRMYADAIGVEVTDENGAVIAEESATWQITSGDPMPFHQLFNCCEADVVPCSEKVLRDFQINFKKLHPYTHKIKITFTGEAKAGAVFVGKSVEIPCLSYQMPTQSREPKEAQVNELSGLREITAKNSVKLKTTNMKIGMVDEKEASIWYPYIESKIGQLIYLNTRFTNEIGDDDLFAYRSHGGFLTDVRLDETGLIMSATLSEYNNA